MKVLKEGFIIPDLSKEQARQLLEILKNTHFAVEKGNPKGRPRAGIAIPRDWPVIEMTIEECTNFVGQCEGAGIATASWGDAIVSECASTGSNVKLNLEHIFKVVDSVVTRVTRRTVRAGRGE